MKKLLYILLFSVTLISCKKGFLDRYPQTEVSPQLFFNTESDLSMYINGMLDLTGAGLYVNGTGQSTDNYATTGQVYFKAVLAGTTTSQNTPNFWTWGGLRTINYFLENYSKAQVPDAVKNHYAGLARYYRAKFYMNKVLTYSDAPWYGRTLNPDDSTALYMAQSPRALIIDSIMNDLEFAAANVRESVPAATPGLYAVKTIYARFALYEGTYRKYHPELNLQATAGKYFELARKQSDDIIASNKFALAGSYASLFNNQDLSGVKEVILNNPYDVAKGKSSGIGNFNIFGLYEQSPARDLVQTYLKKDGTRFTDQPGYKQMQYVQEFADRDPRLSATIAPPGFTLVQSTAPYVSEFSTNFTGYHQIKGYINTTDNNVINNTDIPVLRYAEVLLTYAEAVAELGTASQGDMDRSVNLLRTRVSMPPLNVAAANANPDPVLAADYPNVSGANKGLILEIRRERRVEFALEGTCRFEDLMRWGAGKLFEKRATGMYFPGPGNYDLTGDNIADIKLVTNATTIPPAAQREKNAMGVTLIYYKMGAYGQSGAGMYFENGDSGGQIVTVNSSTVRTFVEPKYYYMPIPFSQTTMNPNLKQPFGWQ